MKKPVFTGSCVAIVTPMHDDFTINYQKFGELLDWQIENGTDSILICGTTGEYPTMTDQEHVQCIRYGVERIAGRVPVVAGAGSNDTAYAVWLSKEAKQAGADSLLHITPYNNKTSQRGLIRHFNIIADATDLPVIIYNVPSRTGLDVKPETYRELSAHPNIVATKEANNNISAITRTVGLCGDDLILYSGNDDQIVPLMALGGLGVISVLANIMPREVHDICRLFLDGNLKESAKMQTSLMPLIAALFSDVNPIPVKEAVNLIGRAAGPCRLPLVEMADKEREVMIAEMRRWNLVG